jgi:hypothetical protein
MDNDNLPKIYTLGEVAEYLKVKEDLLLNEFEHNNIHGFKIAGEWRCTDKDILDYINSSRATYEGIKTFDQIRIQSDLVKPISRHRAWSLTQIEPFDFSWPKKEGSDINNVEHYDLVYEATKVINNQEFTFKIGFGNRETSGQMRRRVTIWLGNRAIVEFAGSNNFEQDGLLAGIIRLKNGKQLTTLKIPEEYRNFRVEKYNSIVRGARASTGMAVIVNKEDLESMLEHAVIRAKWKEII